jgi:hypothetical protein
VAHFSTATTRHQTITTTAAEVDPDRRSVVMLRMQLSAQA